MIASALAIYTNLQTKDRQGFLSQSQTPISESSSLPTDSKSTADTSTVRRNKKPSTEKDTH